MVNALSTSDKTVKLTLLNGISRHDQPAWSSNTGRASNEGISLKSIALLGEGLKNELQQSNRYQASWKTIYPILNIIRGQT